MSMLVLVAKQLRRNRPIEDPRVDLEFAGGGLVKIVVDLVFDLFFYSSQQAFPGPFVVVDVDARAGGKAASSQSTHRRSSS